MRMRGIPTLKRYFSRSYNLTTQRIWMHPNNSFDKQDKDALCAEQLGYYFRVTLHKNTLPVEAAAGGHSMCGLVL